MTDRSWQLRAMSVAELLDETIHLYRHTFLTFIGIVALLQVPITLVDAALDTYAAGVGGLYPPFAVLDPAAVTPIARLAVLILDILFVRILIVAAMARTVSDRYLGRPVSILAAYHVVLRRFFPLLGATVLTFLINVGLIALFGFVAIVPCLRTVAGLALGIALIVINIRLTFVAQIVVLEEKSPRAAISQSWDLVKGFGWRVVGIVLVLGIFSLLIVEGPAYLITFVLTTADASPVVEALATGFTTAALTIFYTPIRMAGLTLLYYDLRIRTEGFDLELQAESLVRERLAITTTGAVPPA